MPLETLFTDLLTRVTVTEKWTYLIGRLDFDEGDGQLTLNFVRQHFSNGISYINTHHRKQNTLQTVLYLNAIQKTFTRPVLIVCTKI